MKYIYQGIRLIMQAGFCCWLLSFHFFPFVIQWSHTNTYIHTHTHLHTIVPIIAGIPLLKTNKLIRWKRWFQWRKTCFGCVRSCLLLLTQSLNSWVCVSVYSIWSILVIMCTFSFKIEVKKLQELISLCGWLPFQLHLGKHFAVTVKMDISACSVHTSVIPIKSSPVCGHEHPLFPK